MCETVVYVKLALALFGNVQAIFFTPSYEVNGER